MIPAHGRWRQEIKADGGRIWGPFSLRIRRDRITTPHSVWGFVETRSPPQFSPRTPIGKKSLVADCPVALIFQLSDSDSRLLLRLTRIRHHHTIEEMSYDVQEFESNGPKAQ